MKKTNDNVMKQEAACLCFHWVNTTVSVWSNETRFWIVFIMVYNDEHTVYQHPLRDITGVAEPVRLTHLRSRSRQGQSGKLRSKMANHTQSMDTEHRPPWHDNPTLNNELTRTE